MRRLLLAAVLGSIATPALADPLGVTKTATVVSDTMGNLIPRSLPGSVVDYRITLTNPLGNLLKPVRAIVIEDELPPDMILRVADIGGNGSGPAQFTDGGILGLLGSGLSYSFTNLADPNDGIDFSNGTSWSYTPVPDANGYDANVRAVRIKPTTTFATGGSFQIRFRTKLR